jgi:hypothetical protein
LWPTTIQVRGADWGAHLGFSRLLLPGVLNS